MACLLCLLVKMWILVRLYREAKTCPRDSLNYQHNTSALAGLSTRKVAKECLLFNSPRRWIFFVQLHTLQGEKSEMGQELNNRYITESTVDSWLVEDALAPFAAVFFCSSLFEGCGAFHFL